MEFDEYINSYYESIKSKCKYACSEFNQDVFHDTLVKCSDKLSNMSANEMDNYIYIAFKTNMIREHQYARNRLKTEVLELPDVGYNLTSNIDLNKLSEIINQKFGENSFEQFCEWKLDHKSISEIEKAFGEKGLYRKFKNIKQKVVEFYGLNFESMM